MEAAADLWHAWVVWFFSGTPAMRASLALIAPLAVAASSSALGACKGEECTKASDAAHSLWEKARKTSAKTKLEGGLGWNDLSDAEKGDHYRTWAALEKHAAAVEQAFAVERISWSSGGEARDALKKDFDAYGHKNEYKDFQVLIDEASVRFADAEKACK